ncbi:classical arabinogalactan protein 9-like [Panicum hallii]|uniref:classical arabinogalactan protein 9-like n=1 Tax=Panicum hallii TaxID=206008 RepID=UPI000DF4DC0E|nr:classical arabinogalactan protein 9-like [Panicum hallii]
MHRHKRISSASFPAPASSLHDTAGPPLLPPPRALALLLPSSTRAAIRPSPRRLCSSSPRAADLLTAHPCASSPGGLASPRACLLPALASTPPAAAESHSRPASSLPRPYAPPPNLAPRPASSPSCTSSSWASYLPETNLPRTSSTSSSTRAGLHMRHRSSIPPLLHAR